MLLITLFIHFMEEEVECFQAKQHHERAGYGEHIHATTASKADGGSNPQAGSSCQSADNILGLAENNGTSTNETDTANHLSGYAADVPARCHPVHHHISETIGRNDHKHR